MNKKLVLSSIILTTAIFALSPASASASTSTNSEELKPYNYEEIMDTHFSNIPEEVKNIKVNEIEKESKEYLTEGEVSKTTPEMLAEISDKIENNPKMDTYTEHEANEFAAKLIKENISKEQTIRGITDYIPGYNKLNSAEKKLAKKHPIEFAKYVDTALEASKESKKYYGKSQLYQGNGDAFRHAYWNAILVKRMNGPRIDKVNRAKVWTNAHEAESSGIDKEMDLINNEIGRYHAYENFSDYKTKISKDLRQKVASGVMVRIVNGKLIATSRFTGK